MSNVEHPDHYCHGSIECIDAIQAALSPEEFAGFIKGSVIKYCWRNRHKGGDEDLAKARWYLERYLKIKGSAEQPPRPKP